MFPKSPFCEIKQGKLKGKVEIDRNGEEFLSFLGIPYAKPPTGKLRFKAPQPPEEWEGTRDATEDGNPCYAMQEEITEKGWASRLRGSEDCLFVNVYTKELPEGNVAPKPVMLFIHGGAFLTGSNETTYFNPTFLLTEDIVLVAINYRLGALGFLRLEDPSLDVPGNAGLKDQVQALKWVQENIKAFGGDPGNVTIFGHSAGSASVHFLILSPLASGLFHKAIMQSGSVISPWAFGQNNALELAETLGCGESDQTKILEFLQELPVETLVEGQNKIGETLRMIDKRPFSPNFESPESPGAFIWQQPHDIMKNGTYNHVPLMIGYTELEANMTDDLEWSLFKEKDFVPYQFQIKKDDPKYKELREKITKYYYGSPILDDGNLKALFLVISDLIFVRGIYETVRELAKTSTNPIFFYRLSKTSFHLGTKVDGVGHCEDLFFLCPTKMGPADEITTRRFVKMWANFARWGNPTPVTDDVLLGVEWKGVRKEEINFLDIGDELVAGVDPDGDRMVFWDGIMEEIEQIF